jgi:aminoglycoside N3'-acetyltransferase
VGGHCDELVHGLPLIDPLYPIRKMLVYHSHVLMVGVGFNSVTSIHLAEECRKPSKFLRERALTVSSKGPTWVEVAGLGCSNGFERIEPHLSRKVCRETTIGIANLQLYPMKTLVEAAGSLLDDDPDGLTCENKDCLSCPQVAR